MIYMPDYLDAGYLDAFYLLLTFFLLYRISQI